MSYYDKYSKIDGLKKKLIPFLDKDLSYAWEEEFRIVGFPKQYTEPYLFLNIGSLKDISELLIIKSKEEAEKIINQYIPNAVYENGKYFSNVRICK